MRTVNQPRSGGTLVQITTRWDMGDRYECVFTFRGDFLTLTDRAGRTLESLRVRQAQVRRKPGARALLHKGGKA